MYFFLFNILSFCINYCWLIDLLCLEFYSCEFGIVFWVLFYWLVVRVLISLYVLYCWRFLIIYVVDGLFVGFSIGFGWVVVINIYFFCLVVLRFFVFLVGVCCSERNIEVLEYWFNKIINFIGIWILFDITRLFCFW